MEWLKGKVSSISNFLFGRGIGVLVLLALLGLLGVGVFLLSAWCADDYPRLASALNSAGGALLGGGAATLLSQTVHWKDAAEAVMKDLATRFEGPLRSVLTLGISEVVWFDEAVPWPRWLQNAKHFEVAALASRNLFVGDSRSTILRFLERRETELVVVFADPDDQPLMEFYDRAFDETTGMRATKIREAMQGLREMATTAGAVERVTIRVAKRPLHFALYRIDSGKTLYTPIWSKPMKAPQRIPGIMFGEGDMTSKALSDEVDYLVSDEGSKVIK